MEMGGETMELLRRGVSSLERLAPAMERLAEEPEIQIPAFPAVCPHCEKMNPNVRVEESAAEGGLGEYVIRAHCTHCNNIFYALPMQWICVKSVQDAEIADQERAERLGYNKG